jgi:IS4 transposase
MKRNQIHLMYLTRRGFVDLRWRHVFFVFALLLGSCWLIGRFYFPVS